MLSASNCVPTLADVSDGPVCTYCTSTYIREMVEIFKFKFNKLGTKMLECRCALFGCNNSRIGTKITNSEIYKEALKHARRV
jgi:hypothetical protein